MRGYLTGYVVPLHVGDGTSMAWETSSAAAVAAATAVTAVAHSQVCYVFVVSASFAHVSNNFHLGFKNICFSAATVTVILAPSP